jgi:hypothetical protein
VTEDDTLRAFLAWTDTNGLTPQPRRDHEDAVMADDYGVVTAKAKSATSSVGLDIDTTFGQLLRRAHPDHPSTTHCAVVVPASVESAALHVDATVREQLRIDLYVVGDDGVVDNPLGSTPAVGRRLRAPIPCENLNLNV